MPKLTEKERQYIRELLESGTNTPTELTQLYNVCLKTIYNIANESPVDVTAPDEHKIKIIGEMIRRNLYNDIQISQRFGIEMESIHNPPLKFILNPDRIKMIREMYASGPYTIKMISERTELHPFLIEEVVEYTDKFLEPFTNPIPLRSYAHEHIPNDYISGEYSTHEIALIYRTTPYDAGQVMAHRGQVDRDRAKINREKYIAASRLPRPTK